VVRRKNFIAVIFLIILVLIGEILGFDSCKDKQEESNLDNVETVEIKEYEGENLSSVTSLPDNSIKGPQYVNLDDYRLAVNGLVNTPLSLPYNDVLSRYQSQKKVVKLDCVEGWSATILWEGVSIKDLLADAGIQSTANTVIFHSYDGYTTSLPLDYIVNNNILLAYQMNGLTLLPERGFPFSIVAESKWGYKWAKWVTGIELSADENYRGYWENRGYSNNGDLDKDFIGP
jgi:DMSO/TMAO reductase YedYZ molybdopterin-dependent catalytic subunit